MASHRRGPWSQAEDSYLVQLVHTQGALNWVRIAQLIGSRSPKQCRERYHQNLKPSLNHEPISPEEGLQIERMVGEMGKRWAEIARRLHGRSDNAVKNWWNGSMNRRRRLVVRRNGSSRDPVEFEGTPDSNHSNTRPSEQSHSRSLTINSGFPSHHQLIERPLPSPSTSEVSMDGAPSLISDTGSILSVSPRGAISPAFELPPLNVMRAYPRRPSISTAHLNSTHSTEVDPRQQSYFAPYQTEEKYGKGNASQSPLSQQTEQPYGYFTARPHQFTSTTPTHIHLPPLQSIPESSRRLDQRDNRMNLSSLLR